VSFRDDGDALLARNAALEADNAKLREENDRLKAPPEESVALTRKTPQYIAVQDRVPWYRRAGAKVGMAIVWVAAVVVAILQGVL
jgi:hypothetical protein